MPWSTSIAEYLVVLRSTWWYCGVPGRIANVYHLRGQNIGLNVRKLASKFEFEWGGLCVKAVIPRTALLAFLVYEITVKPLV